MYFFCNRPFFVVAVMSRNVTKLGARPGSEPGNSLPLYCIFLVIWEVYKG